ncbi:MAG: hypothetical protein ACXWHI_06735, partial [Candidatus Aminicenantales bacterium]
MVPESDRQSISTFRERIVDEIVRALGASPSGAARRLIGPLFRLPARRFARIMARSDDEIRTSGLPGGAASILHDFGLELVVWGDGHIPQEGPLVVASNHPGAYDSLALMASIPRTDLKIVISDVGFTRALPAARERFIFALNTTRGRSQALRDSLRHLAGGGALLIYPHADVEPDPETMPGAREALGDWSRSLEIMLRRIPATRLQLAIASGVLLPRFIQSPLVRFRRSAPRRQKLAEFLQVSWQLAFPKRVRPRLHLSFAAPVDPAAL